MDEALAEGSMERGGVVDSASLDVAGSLLVVGWVVVEPLELLPAAPCSDSFWLDEPELGLLPRLAKSRESALTNLSSSEAGD